MAFASSQILSSQYATLEQPARPSKTTNSHVIETFSKAVEPYVKRVVSPTRFPLYHSVADSLYPIANGLVLDIGPGPGFLSEIIARKNPYIKVTWIEPAKNMFDYAVSHSKGLPNLEF